LGWVCECGLRLTDRATGAPAPATPGPDDDLLCISCERRYVYVPDAETLEERVARPHEGAPA
jgi:hypothetical protein